MPEMKAAIVLSIMGALYAVAGSIIALMCKAVLNRRTIFLKIFSFNTLMTFSILLIFICLDVHSVFSGYIAITLFCIISFGASLSPLLVPLLHDYNGAKVANTSVSIMTAGFYFVVAILGNMSGLFFDIFAKNNATVHSTTSYLAIFSLMVILALISFINVFKIEESEKTQRLIKHLNNIKDKEKSEHWHDKYEHDLYSNI